MSSKPSPAELHTTRELHRFEVEMLDLLAQHFGGKTTLNHLRVGSFVGWCSQCQGRSTSNREIAQELKISRATVSRIVADFIAAGWISEKRHPNDGRKRLLQISDDHPHKNRFERALRKRLNGLFTKVLTGDMVIVDHRKDRF